MRSLTPSEGYYSALLTRATCDTWRFIKGQILSGFLLLIVAFLICWYLLGTRETMSEEFVPFVSSGIAVAMVVPCAFVVHLLFAPNAVHAIARAILEVDA